ncbi:MAG: DUF4326 domain-containing protein [Microbacteriaceae bacterium]
MPTRIQRKRTKGWRKPEGAVDVTRLSDWGNPFRVGDAFYVGGARVWITQQLAVDLFKAFMKQLGPGIYQQIRDELGGKDLMCFCRLDQPCHADVLLKIANEGVKYITEMRFGDSEERTIEVPE